MTAMGSFQIVERIAEGGMGALYRARDPATSRMVALKTTRRGSRAETAGLRCEGAILRQLQHPGIVRILAHGRHEGRPWIALELLEGRTLQDEVEALWAGAPHRHAAGARRLDGTPTVSLRPAAQAPSPPTAVPARSGRPLAGGGRLGHVCAIAGELAAILDHVHARGLVHRDVKPANVFLRAVNDGPARVTLLDFGLACRASRTGARGHSALCVGTMQYAAPEQILGDPVDGRADIYALGCVLYQLVTGVCPFEGPTSRVLAREQVSRAPLAPSLLVSRLPAPIEELIMEMLAKEPDQRPASAGAVAVRLARASASLGGRIV